MKIVKEEIKKIIDNLPDDLTYEELQYHIYVHQKIQNGLKDIKEGRVISHDEMKKRMAKWIEK